VGKRKLEAAVEQTKDKFEVQVSWEPFLLRPSMPEDGIVKPPNYQGAPKGPLKSAGEAVGINFTGKTPRFPNTVPCHALLEYAKDKLGWKKQNELQEIIFQAYFTDGIYPGGENLVALAEKAGVDKAAAQAVITDKAKLKAAKEKALDWSDKGVSGVPYVIMNGQKVFSGAQDAATFVNMFEIVAERFPLQGQQPQAAM